MIKFSFLIALYNGERFIPDLLDCLLNQDIPHEEYEIIFLDDCSPDKSSDIVRLYQKKHSNIKLYKNEKNRRIATNVNILTSLASGKYFWLIGQDDKIKTNCLKDLWEMLEQDNLDLILFNYNRVTEENKFLDIEDTFVDSPKQTGLELIHSQFANRDYCNYILGYEWRAVFNVDFYRNNNIRCVDGLNWEDTIILFKAIVLSDSVKSISDRLYFYTVNPSSISFSSNHIKKGNYIFEFAFMVGDEVENFYYELANIDTNLMPNLLNQIKWRYNSFAFDLIRTSVEQKFLFYKEVNKHMSIIKKKRHWLNWKSKLLIVPCIGVYFSIALGCAYRIKKSIL